MKIVNRKTFLTLPEGTVYFKLGYSERLCVKHETLGDDWYYKDFDSIGSFSDVEERERLEEMKQTGKSYPISKSFMRDGLFDFDETFMIYEKEDIIYLVSELTKNISKEELIQMKRIDNLRE